MAPFSRPPTRFTVSGRDERHCRLDRDDVESVERTLADEDVGLWAFGFLGDLAGQEYDVAVSSDHVKKSRGMRPKALFAYYKMREWDEALVHAIQRQAQASAASLAPFMTNEGPHQVDRRGDG